MSQEIALIPAFRPEARRKAKGSNFLDKSLKTNTRTARFVYRQALSSYVKILHRKVAIMHFSEMNKTLQ